MFLVQTQKNNSEDLAMRRRYKGENNFFNDTPDEAKRPNR